jgi:predicted permease
MVTPLFLTICAARDATITRAETTTVLGAATARLVAAARACEAILKTIGTARATRFRTCQEKTSETLWAPEILATFFGASGRLVVIRMLLHRLVKGPCAIRLRALLQRRRVARELDDELAFHLERETELNVGRGLPPAAARRQAVAAFGGLLQTKEAVQDVRALPTDAIWQDLRHGFRAMRKRPGFAVLAVMTLALGIGVNAAAFAMAYGILVRPLPYTDPSRLVILNLLFEDGGDLGFSPPALQEWLPRLRTVEAAAGYYRREVTVRYGLHSTVVPAAVVTDGFFDVLGTPAEAGQARADLDSSEVVISRRRAHQVLEEPALDALGRPLLVSERGHTIGGIMPYDFAFPDDEIGVWLPSRALRPDTKPQDAGYSRIVARLKPGVSLEQARDDANRVRLELDPDTRQMISLTPVGESLTTGMRTLLVAALAGAFLVLVVACANVATLFIGREVARQRELAARMALGATRARLVTGVLIESALIAVVASLVGVGLGAAALRVFLAQASGTLPGLHRIDLDLSVALAIVVLTMIVTLLCGAVPAWHAARQDFTPFLRPTAGSGPRAWRLRRALVVAQIAFSSVLLIGAGLLGRSVSALMHEDHGFQPAGALAARIVLSDAVLFDGTGRETYIRELLDRVRSIPGVRHAGFGSTLPPRTPPVTMAIRLINDGRFGGPVRDETRFMKLGAVTPGYFPAVGARFLAGRDFDARDGDSRTPVVILSESVARFYFPAEDSVGRTIGRLPGVFGIDGSPQVVGVVSDMKYDGLDSPAASAIYIPWAHRPFGTGYLIVRRDGDPTPLGPELRLLARALDPTVPISEVLSLEQVRADSIGNRRMRALPAVGFAVLALAVACVGVLATLATLVAERRRDLAIRSALGASPTHLVRMIVGQGLVLTAVGLGAGMAAGLAGAQGLSSLLYGISPYDTATFLGTALLIGAGATLMAYIAALRVRSIDPIVMLRHE